MDWVARSGHVLNIFVLKLVILLLKWINCDCSEPKKSHGVSTFHRNPPTLYQRQADCRWSGRASFATPLPVNRWRCARQSINGFPVEGLFFPKFLPSSNQHCNQADITIYLAPNHCNSLLLPTECCGPITFQDFLRKRSVSKLKGRQK